MKLDNVTATIRPRGKWESVDLGVALVQQNFKAVATAWSLTTLPLMLVLAGFGYFWYSQEGLWFGEGTPLLLKLFYVYLPFFLVWWLQPVFERVPLYVLSRSLFGEKVSIGQLVAQWPRMMVRDAFTLLVVRRISMSRSFVMPIHELEGLSGHQYKQRVNLLMRNGGDGASSLTIATVLLSFVLLFSGYVTLRWLTMYGFSIEGVAENVDSFWYAMGLLLFDENSIFPLMFVLISYMAVISILSPFYSGAGFAIYVNSRTISEGWDIELSFKRMSERLKKLREKTSHSILSIIFWVALSVVASSGVTEAQEPFDGPQTVVNDILEGEDFDLRISKTPVYAEKGETSAAKSDDREYDYSGDREAAATAASSAVSLGSVILYLVCGGILVGLIILILKNLHIFRGGRPSLQQDLAPVKVKTVLGMDVTPESLPDDLLTVVRKAWDKGDKKLALSILYRGSLEWMVNTARLPIEEGDTEADCVRHCNKVDNAPVKQYFAKLTDEWVNLAYGNIAPQDSSIDWLTNDWPFNTRAGLERGQGE